jgi:hypothetical protein
MGPVLEFAADGDDVHWDWTRGMRNFCHVVKCLTYSLRDNEIDNVIKYGEISKPQPIHTGCGHATAFANFLVC